MSFVCEKCSKTFNKKTDYTRHVNRKISCDGKNLVEKLEEVKEEIEEIKRKVEEVEEKVDDNNGYNTTAAVLRIVNKCHNIMRTNDQVIGQKAFHDINKLLFLTFIQPYIKPGERLETLTDCKVYMNANPSFEEQWLDYLNVENILKADSTTIDNSMSELEEVLKIMWKKVLCDHPLTRNIFKKQSFFNSSPKVIRSCLYEIYKGLADIDFDKLDNDVKGVMYEHFINNYANKNGKEFGQFFTPRKLITLVFKLNKEVFPNMSDRKFNKVYDPCAGTAGFLTELYKELGLQNSNQLYGGELEPETYASALMNVLLTTGNIGNLAQGDSLLNNSLDQFDYIATNPPFGMKGIKHANVCSNLLYEDDDVPTKLNKKKKLLTCLTAKQMYPVKTNDGSALFLQHCAAKLNNGGICNIVLPDGQLLAGRNFIKLREYLIDYCELYAVLSVPNGAFENAGVSTAVLFFSKSESNCTGDVKFYSTDVNCNDYKLEGVVSREQLEENNYVLQWRTYAPVEHVTYNTNVEIKKLSELCEIKNGKNITKSKLIDGPYPVVGGGKSPMGFHNNYNTEENSIIISKDGAYAGYVSMYDTKTWITGHGLHVVPNENINKMYLYYYIKANQQKLYEMQKGSCQPGVNKDDLYELPIPVPSLEVQTQIVNQCNDLVNCQNTLELAIRQMENSISIYTNNTVNKLFNKPNVEVKKLSELCKLLPTTKHTTSIGNNEGKYRFYNASQTDKLYLDSYEIDDTSIIIGNGGNGCIHIDKYFTPSKHVTVCQVKDQSIDINYLYYYLYSNKNIVYNDSKGATISWLNKESINKIQIPVPSLEDQKTIINSYETHINVITQYNNKLNSMRESYDLQNNIMRELFSF